MEHADGLRECRKMLMMAKAGKYNGYLLEGMGLSRRLRGRRGQAITPVKKSTAAVTRYVNEAKVKSVQDSARSQAPARGPGLKNENPTGFSRWDFLHFVQNFRLLVQPGGELVSAPPD